MGQALRGTCEYWCAATVSENGGCAVAGTRSSVKYPRHRKVSDTSPAEFPVGSGAGLLQTNPADATESRDPLGMSVVRLRDTGSREGSLLRIFFENSYGLRLPAETGGPAEQLFHVAAQRFHDVGEHLFVGAAEVVELFELTVAAVAELGAAAVA